MRSQAAQKSAIFIPGLPASDADIQQTVFRIQGYLGTVGFTWSPYDWTREHGFRDAYRLLREGKFGTAHASSFSRWLSERKDLLEREFIVVAYSFGGFIFYKWLSTVDPDAPILRRLQSAITIASPYDLAPSGAMLFESAGGRILSLVGLGEDRLDPTQITRRLAGRLTIVVGSEDMTSLPDNTFLPAHLAESAQIAQVIALGANHLDILEHEITLEALRLAVRSTPA